MQVDLWQATMAPEVWTDMVEKYRSLQHLEGLPEGPAQVAAIRRAARRWPGSLRESQLVGPDRCARRLRCAQAASNQPPQTRAHWRNRGDDHTAVVLWAELHPMVGDYVAWRQRTSTGPRDAKAFVAFVEHRVPPGRWPTSAEVLCEFTGDKLRARTAYLWLAARAGMRLPDLQRLLFAREGHWETRPGDPVMDTKPRKPRA